MYTELLFKKPRQVVLWTRKLLACTAALQTTQTSCAMDREVVGVYSCSANNPDKFCYGQGSCWRVQLCKQPRQILLWTGKLLACILSCSLKPPDKFCHGQGSCWRVQLLCKPQTSYAMDREVVGELCTHPGQVRLWKWKLLTLKVKQKEFK